MPGCGAYRARNSISRRGEGAPGRAPGNELHQLALADALQGLVDLCIWVKAHGWTMSMLVWVSDRTTTLFLSVMSEAGRSMEVEVVMGDK